MLFLPVAIADFRPPFPVPELDVPLELAVLSLHGSFFKPIRVSFGTTRVSIRFMLHLEANYRRIFCMASYDKANLMSEEGVMRNR